MAVTEQVMQYKIAYQNNVGVLAISGDITRNDREILEKCQQEIASLQTKIMVILFKNVVNVEPVAFRDLTMIQHELRKKMELRVVGLDLSIKMTLSRGGVIRLAEIRNSFDEAIAA